MGVLLGGERHPKSLRLPDAEAGFARPELESRPVVRSQPESLEVEGARSFGVLRRDGHEVEPGDHRSLRFEVAWDVEVPMISARASRMACPLRRLLPCATRVGGSPRLARPSRRDRWPSGPASRRRQAPPVRRPMGAPVVDRSPRQSLSMRSTGRPRSRETAGASRGPVVACGRRNSISIGASFPAVGTNSTSQSPLSRIHVAP